MKNISQNCYSVIIILAGLILYGLFFLYQISRRRITLHRPLISESIRIPPMAKKGYLIYQGDSRNPNANLFVENYKNFLIDLSLYF